jgi:long-subunit fatty acid transport protein
VAPAVAYQVADVLALGFALRVGIAQFEATDTEAAFRAEGLSATGAGIGGSFALMARPHPRVQVGALYRTALTTSMSGSGKVAIGGGAAAPRDLSLTVTWPQSAVLGVAVRAASFLRLVAQGDWTGWSSIQKLEVAFSGGLAQPKGMRFADNFTLHAGAEGTFSRFAVRLGFGVDTNAIPDATSRRENRDGLKYDITGGAGVRVGPARIDAAVDYLFGLDNGRVIPKGPEAEAGVYRATVLTFELSGTVAF